MVIGIGCDIVQHTLTKELDWADDSKIRDRIFSDTELSNCPAHRTVEFFSGRFAVKEAVLKCLGTGMQDGISLTDIHVLKSDNGKPFIELYGKVLEIANEIQIKKWQVSISHTVDYSIAFVIAED